MMACHISTSDNHELIKTNQAFGMFITVQINQKKPRLLDLILISLILCLVT